MKLSVIIPGYNNLISYWERCVNSVSRAATLVVDGFGGTAEVEIICVDDCSVRERPKSDMFDDMSRDGVGIRVIRLERNRGLAGARNAALEIARGEYVTFVDSDDEVLPEVFERSVRQLDRTNSDVCFFGVKTVWFKDGLFKVDNSSDANYGTLTPDDVKTIWNSHLLNYAWNKVYRRDFLLSNELKFPEDGMPCEDIIFNLNVIMAGAKFCSVDYIGYVYYRGATTILSSYCPTFVAGMRKANETWKRYKEVTPGAREVLGVLGELSDAALAFAEKKNMLRPRSPLWYAPIYCFLRSLLYIRPVRRWHIKRTFPTATEA